MSRYAIVKNGLVDNIVIANQPVPKIQGLWVCIDSLENPPGPGWIYEDGVFSLPKEDLIDSEVINESLTASHV